MRRRAEARAACRDAMRAERRAIRDLVVGLTPEQWEAPSLCAAWNVRDVVAHLVGWDDVLLYRSRRQHAIALLRFVALYVRSVASMRLVNRHIQRRTRVLAPDDLIDRFATDDGPDLKWLFDGTNPAAHLAEYVIHHQDVRRPLGLPAVVPEERLAAALDGVLQLPGVRVPAWRRLRRTRVEATDLEWARGHGHVRRLAGEEILMWLAGRTE